jgi:hypothetical protein
MRRLMNDNRIKHIIDSSGVQVKGLDLLKSRPTVGSLSANDQFSSDEMELFWFNSRRIEESIITGREDFPGEMLSPKSENELLSGTLLNRIVEFYNDTYEAYNFRKPADAIPEPEMLQNSVAVRVKMDKFGRCRIGSEVFGSVMSLRHEKSSFVLAKFVTSDNAVDCYPGQVQYYFTHTVDFSDGPSKHYLAYVRWYLPADSTSTRYYFSIEEDNEITCNVELWKTGFYPESRDCIIPVHNILGRFVPVKYKISSRQNAIEYFAINPINRKFHIR